MDLNNPRQMLEYNFDFLIIGSGLAGLYAAICAAAHGRVGLLTKATLHDSSSYWAQGGIAAAIDPEDSVEMHFDDTLRAGRGLCREAAVQILVSEGVDRIRDLIAMGMAFDADAHGLHLGLEGGHSHRRILHADGSATGAAVVNFLLDRVKAHPNITLFENTTVAELVAHENRCAGVIGFPGDEISPRLFTARATILATGGAAGCFLRTTNPPTSTGDGIALAYRAGAEVCDMEFVQFHPTALWTESGETFLVSEALRGEGGQLFDVRGRRFMPEYDPRAELAPRDVVASAIFREMRQEQVPYVHLSMRHLDAAYIAKRFANIGEVCRRFGVDITQDLIPVAPAAHYFIGGVVTGRMAGTSLWGLFACGETACTGVHGANRLASNSLLECLVFAKRAVDGALTLEDPLPRRSLLQDQIPVRDQTPVDPELIHELRLTIARRMTENLGILREGEEMQRALDEFLDMRQHYHALFARWAGRPLRGMLRVCTLIARAALYRQESRGAHIRADFPGEDPAFDGHITLRRGHDPRIVKWT